MIGLFYIKGLNYAYRNYCFYSKYRRDWFYNFLATKITRNDLPFLSALLIALVGALVGLVPYIGGILSLITFFVMLKKLGDMDIWPDAILVAIATVFISFVMSLLLVSALGAIIATA